MGEYSPKELFADLLSKDPPRMLKAIHNLQSDFANGHEFTMIRKSLEELETLAQLLLLLQILIKKAASDDERKKANEKYSLNGSKYGLTVLRLIDYLNAVNLKNELGKKGIEILNKGNSMSFEGVVYTPKTGTIPAHILRACTRLDESGNPKGYAEIDAILEELNERAKSGAFQVVTRQTLHNRLNKMNHFWKSKRGKKMFKVDELSNQIVIDPK